MRTNTSLTATILREVSLEGLRFTSFGEKHIFSTHETKNGRRKLIFPRPRLVSVIALIESIQHANAKKRREALQRFDEDLANAVSKDMSTYVGEVMSSVA